MTLSLIRQTHVHLLQMNQWNFWFEKTGLIDIISVDHPQLIFKYVNTQFNVACHSGHSTNSRPSTFQWRDTQQNFNFIANAISLFPWNTLSIFQPFSDIWWARWMFYLWPDPLLPLYIYMMLMLTWYRYIWFGSDPSIRCLCALCSFHFPFSVGFKHSTDFDSQSRANT